MRNEGRVPQYSPWDVHINCPTHPWEKFILATFIPFSMSSRSMAGSLETGPMVHTIPGDQVS